MKKNIISLFLAFTIFVFNFLPVNAFAPSIPISYELLMGLMGIGTSFGLSIPENDEQYWDYTRSLKNHLNVVDEEYLRLLAKVTVEWKTQPPNNDNDPNNNTPFIVPIVSGAVTMLSKLFDNVGKEVSQEYQYVDNLISPLPLGKPVQKYSTRSNFIIQNLISSSGALVSLKHTFDSSSNSMVMEIINHSNERVAKGNISSDYAYISPYINISSDGSLSVQNVKYYINGNPSYGSYSYFEFDSGGTRALYLDKSSYPVYQKEPIPYSPVEPNIENDELIIPGGIPNINIPVIDTVPGITPGDDVVPPFDVADPIPGTNPNPGDDINPGEGTIWEQILGFVTSLLVPSESFWTDNFNDFRDNFGNAFPILDMSKFNDLVVNGKPFPNIDINIMGIQGRVVNGDVINSIVDWLRPIIAGFIMLCLMFFNYRKIYKLIRNSEPFGGIAPGTSDFRTGISENNSYEIAQAKIRDTMFDIRNEFLSNKNKEGK